MSNFNYLLLIFLFLTLWVNPNNVASTNNKTNKSKKSKKPSVQIENPIYYEADHQEGDLDGYSYLKGKVKIIQEDISIRSDEAKLFWTTNPNEPQKLIVFGDVIFKNEDSIGYCEKGTFLPKLKKFIMLGNPVIHKEKSHI